MFARRRPATNEELAALVVSFEVNPPPDGLVEAEVSDVTRIEDLASLRTVLQRTRMEIAGSDPFLTVAEAASRFQRPDNTNQRDTGPFRHFLALSADPTYRPVLLIEPNGADYRLIDGVHRAAALFVARTNSGRGPLELPVFVLPRPLR